MPTSEEAIMAARKKSEDMLRVSIASLCAVLGLNQEEIDEEFKIPVSEEDRLHKSYSSLVQMCENLRRLEALNG
jgi:hypothetical protein